MTRREFLVAAVAAGWLAGDRRVLASVPPMPQRSLGGTGHQVRLFSLGGQSALEQSERREEALRIIQRALDVGVNYFDTAPKYGEGLSEKHLGEGLGARRREIFLASKTHERASRDRSLKLLEQSLKSLRTDYLDLWQLHNVREHEHVDQIFAPGGGLEALVRARDEGMVRFLGITGHYDPMVLVKALERFHFDCVLVPVNPADRHPLLFVDRWIPHRDRNRLSFIERLLPVAEERGVGVIGMKIPARGRLFRPDGLTSMKQAMGYALSQPISTVIIGCDTVAQLEANVTIAREFKPLSAAELARLEGLTEPYAREAAWFKQGGNGAGDNTQ